ncbi:MAG TPA: lysophospholipid acyltransferase family protein [Pyrinomonadaceae bacterium]|nr:lysophospholipid acyltransferase family protein [Pyrinomonadaceae bacterium]
MPSENKKISEVYRFAPLSGYSFKQRWLIRIADFAFYCLINLIGKTVRFEAAEGWENFEAIEQAGRLPIYTFWHNRIFLGTYFFRRRGIVVITSQSFDGEYIARFIQRFGYGAVRGSSTRGGVAALVEMIRLMRAGLPMGFTIDGPKGPKYVAKIGACLLAKKTGNPMMPFTVEAEKFWRLKSWDNLQIPKPFSRARVIINEPIYVSADASDEILENKRLELQKSLDELVARGEQWRESKVLADKKHFH